MKTQARATTPGGISVLHSYPGYLWTEPDGLIPYKQWNFHIYNWWVLQRIIQMCVDIFIQYIIKYIIQNRKKIKTINMETNKNMETINKAINSLFAIQKQLKKSQLLDQKLKLEQATFLPNYFSITKHFSNMSKHLEW